MNKFEIISNEDGTDANVYVEGEKLENVVGVLMEAAALDADYKIKLEVMHGAELTVVGEERQEPHVRRYTTTYKFPTKDSD